MKKTFSLLILATMFWAGNFFFVKIGLKTLTPISLATGRFVIASLVLFAILFFKRSRFDWVAIRSKLPILLLSGFIGVFLYNLMMFIGLKTTSATNGALIMGLNPLFTLVISFFLMSTKINKIQVMGLILSFTGVLFVISKGSSETIMHLNFSKGDLLMIISSISFGLFNVLNKKYLSTINTFSLTAFTTLPAAILFLLLTITDKASNFNNLEFSALFSILFLAICGSVLAYYFWNHAVKEIGADKSAVFINLVPFFTTVFSLLLGQSIQFAQIVGGSLIIAGVVISNQFKNI